MKTERKHAARIMLVVAMVVLIRLQILHAYQAGKSPVKVFILVGQSNMEGQGKVKIDASRNEGRGSLEYLVKDSVTAEHYKHLVDM